MMYEKCIFPLILQGIPCSLVLFVKNREVGGEGGGVTKQTKSPKCDESYLAMIPNQ